MLKSTAVVLALCAQMVFSYSVIVTNDAGNQVELYIPAGRRICACLKNTQSKTLKGVGAGTVKLFSKTDCTGNFGTMGSNGSVSNAYWVNSISFGANLSSSEGPNGCPNYHNLFAAAADNGQSDAVNLINL